MRGRTVVGLLLVGFVLVATGVIWRRSVGVAGARERERLEQRRVALEAKRAKLEADIRDASSRDHLERLAEERLNMHVPSDSQVILLKRPQRGKPRGPNAPH